MPTTRPFRALRYAPAAGEPARLVAPPYDVVDDEMFRELRARSPYNVVRLTLDRGYSRDLLPPDEWYDQVAGLLGEWTAAGILQRDEQPAYYLYTQRFTHEGKRLHHKLLLCALRLEHYETGRVRPHENTTPGPKAGRLKLLRACRANLSPVLGFVPDEAGTLNRRLEALQEALPPVCRFIDEEGVEHELRLVLDPSEQESLAATLAPLPFYIADGHHRYETGLAFAEMERHRLGNPSDELPSDYVFVACMSGSDPGMVILPTHRVVHWDGGPDAGAVWAAAQEHFDLVPLGAGSPEEAASALVGEECSSAFVLYGGKELGYALARLRDQSAMDDAPWRRDSALRRLPAAIFDHAFVGKVMAGLDRRVDYTPEARRAVNFVDNSPTALGCLLRGVRPPELISVVNSGERMPPKSTYFWPKPKTGMALRPLDGF